MIGTPWMKHIDISVHRIEMTGQAFHQAILISPHISPSTCTPPALGKPHIDVKYLFRRIGVKYDFNVIF
jgi:hypothetical protein